MRDEFELPVLTDVVDTRSTGNASDWEELSSLLQEDLRRQVGEHLAPMAASLAQNALEQAMPEMRKALEQALEPLLERLVDDLVDRLVPSTPPDQTE